MWESHQNHNIQSSQSTLFCRVSLEGLIYDWLILCKIYLTHSFAVAFLLIHFLQAWGCYQMSIKGVPYALLPQRVSEDCVTCKYNTKFISDSPLISHWPWDWKWSHSVCFLKSVTLYWAWMSLPKFSLWVTLWSLSEDWSDNGYPPVFGHLSHSPGPSPIHQDLLKIIESGTDHLLLNSREAFHPQTGSHFLSLRFPKGKCFFNYYNTGFSGVKYLRMYSWRTIVTFSSSLCL